jgi:carboxylesterase type B
VAAKCKAINTTYGNLCLQIQNTINLETSYKDVVVVLHDGGFSHGSGDNANYGPDYLLDHDVVMVTCNNRLGALGKTIIMFNTNRFTFLLMSGML